MNTWRVDQPLWKGQTAFVVGGGPSLLTQNLELLKGQNVIVINSSYLAVPFAQFLIFADARWFMHHAKALHNFKGKIVSCSASVRGPPLIHKLHRKTSRGLATDVGTVMLKETTLTGAINLAVHLGVAKIVLLGVDQKFAADGRTHHHAPHPWKPTGDAFRRHQMDLPTIAEDLKRLNVECVNASPGSALTLWPIVNLEDHVAAADIACVA